MKLRDTSPNCVFVQAEVTSIDMDPQGEHFVAGAGDKLVRLWHYDDGIATGVGNGHSGRVNAVR